MTSNCSCSFSLHISARGSLTQVSGIENVTLVRLIQFALIMFGKQSHAQVVLFCRYSSQWIVDSIWFRRPERCVSYQTVQLMIDTQNAKVTSVFQLYRISHIFAIFHHFFFAILHIQTGCQDMLLSKTLCREWVCLGSPTINESPPSHIRPFRRRIQERAGHHVPECFSFVLNSCVCWSCVLISHAIFLYSINKLRRTYSMADSR